MIVLIFTAVENLDCEIEVNEEIARKSQKTNFVWSF